MPMKSRRPGGCNNVTRVVKYSEGHTEREYSSTAAVQIEEVLNEVLVEGVLAANW
jgi:hypothetical protein